jgi:hypothetical protein
METYSNTGHLEVFQVGLKWILDAGAQLIATTTKLHVAGTEILFIYCFTLAFNKISYLCPVLQYSLFLSLSLSLSLSLVKPLLHTISKCDIFLFIINAALPARTFFPQWREDKEDSCKPTVKMVFKKERGSE